MNHLIRKNENVRPWWGLSNLHRDLDSLFDNFLTPAAGGMKSLGFSPACDFEETDTHYIATFDLGGVKKEDIHLEVKDNQLHVSGEKKEEKKSKEGRMHLSERYYGSFSRVFSMPAAVDPDRVEAQFKDGVLEVRVPKSDKAQGKKISIA